MVAAQSKGALVKPALFITVCVVRILVACAATVHRLPQQSGQLMLRVLASARIAKDFAHLCQSRIARDGCGAELRLDPTVKFIP